MCGFVGYLLNHHFFAIYDVEARASDCIELAAQEVKDAHNCLILYDNALNGIVLFLAFTFASAGFVAFTLTFTFASAGFVAFVLTFTFSSARLIAFALAFAFASARLVAFALTFTFSSAGLVAFALTFAFTGTGLAAIFYCGNVFVGGNMNRVFGAFVIEEHYLEIFD